MRINQAPAPNFTYEGGKASHVNLGQQLERTVMSCLLWEDTFYEDGVSVADRIATLVKKVEPKKVAEIAIKARHEMHLRHVPLLLCRELAKIGKLQSATLTSVIERPDEITEFLALYWQESRCPLSNQVKKGLAMAFTKFNAYSLAKYKHNDRSIKLRDVMFMVHPKPRDPEQAATFKQVATDTLPIPDTWEVALSANDGIAKKDKWTRLLNENRMGVFALIRNLRNMQEAEVEESIVKKALLSAKPDRVLPFRFIAAARHAPRMENELQSMMFSCLAQYEKMPGHTVIVVDCSGSMKDQLSEDSEITRLQAAAALGMMAVEVCASHRIYCFSTDQDGRGYVTELPPRRGFAISDVVESLPHNGTPIKETIQLINRREKYDRLILITDEQSNDGIENPKGKGYIVNVATFQNGIGYGAWTHINGWSENVLRYIMKDMSTEVCVT